jgi:hypothetical protein
VSVPASVPVQATLRPATTRAVEPDTHDLVPGARIVADAYHRATGHPINREALAERLQVPVATAQRLLDALAGTEPTRTARINGTAAVEALA